MKQLVHNGVEAFRYGGRDVILFVLRMKKKYFPVASANVLSLEQTPTLSPLVNDDLTLSNAETVTSATVSIRQLDGIFSKLHGVRKYLYENRELLNDSESHIFEELTADLKGLYAYFTQHAYSRSLTPKSHKIILHKAADIANLAEWVCICAESRLKARDEIAYSLHRNNVKSPLANPTATVETADMTQTA